MRPLRYMWEDTDLQADLTMGNVASALTLQSEDAALIAELRAGSEEAFAWLITHYHQPIYSLLARMVQGFSLGGEVGPTSRIPLALS